LSPTSTAKRMVVVRSDGYLFGTMVILVHLRHLVAHRHFVKVADEGRPSRNRMRSISFSPWIISAMDHSRIVSCSCLYFQFSRISEWTKYRLMAVSS
jgi:hypothetical protein